MLKIPPCNLIKSIHSIICFLVSTVNKSSNTIFVLFVTLINEFLKYFEDLCRTIPYNEQLFVYVNQKMCDEKYYDLHILELV